MKFDFIEIGTSYFDTLIEKSKDEVGLSIEPIKQHFDRLPNKKNVIKLNEAISSETGIFKFYYIPLDVLILNKLPLWLAGCNTINKPHPSVLTECINFNIDPYNIIQIENVKTITVNELIITYNISEVDFLKIDTEGHDLIILNQFIDLISQKKIFVRRILFESNSLSSVDDQNKSIDNLKRLGYDLISRGSDSLLQYTN
jgi:FkbM family methyltransferase